MDIIEQTIMEEITNDSIKEILLKMYNKQVPRQVITRGLGQRYCPECGNGNQKGGFFINCGQALDL